MNRFTIIERDRCVLVEGALPIDWFKTISSHMPKNAISSPTLARMLNCNFAFGLNEDVTALIASIKPAAEAVAVSNCEKTGLSEAAARWLASGERGISSNTIFTRLTGVDSLGGWSQDYPYDPSDLRRCRLLLEQCPELAAKFTTMSGASKKWAALVRDWPAICKAMDEEIPDWRNPKKGSSAPRTYNLIKAAIGEQK